MSSAIPYCACHLRQKYWERIACSVCVHCSRNLFEQSLHALQICLEEVQGKSITCVKAFPIFTYEEASVLTSILVVLHRSH